MIEYNDIADCGERNWKEYTEWLKKVIKSEGYFIGEISYVFTDDNGLLEVNKKYLNRDYFTDIITFDYTENKTLSGDIMISCDRVKENAIQYQVGEDEELRRVMVHGILHLMGYKDATDSDKAQMRTLEELKMEMFHVEQ